MARCDWDINDHGASEVCPAHWKEGKKTNLKVTQLRNWDYFAAFGGQHENGNANGTNCERRLQNLACPRRTGRCMGYTIQDIDRHIIA